MKFDTTAKPDFDTPDDIIGNVYLCKGGNKTRFWIVVAIRVNTVVCLGVDQDGNITSSSNYGLHVFDGCPWSRQPVGKVLDMPDMNFSIRWDARENSFGRRGINP